MEFAEFYLDESESGDGRWLCVAGYTFSEVGRKALQDEWWGLLSTWDVPYFRMTDCAHGNKPFDRLDRDERIEAQKQFFAVLKRHALVGFCATYDMHLAALCPTAIDRFDSRFQITPYTLCCYWALLHSRLWANSTNFNGKIGYFFEAGHGSQSQANRMMEDVFANPMLREHFRYSGHAFVEKGESAAVQCADILAWQWSKNVKERAAGNMKPRADLLALMEIPSGTVHFDRKTIIDFREEIARFIEKAKGGAVSADSIASYWANVSAVPSYWAGRPPFGWMPH